MEEMYVSTEVAQWKKTGTSLGRGCLGRSYADVDLVLLVGIHGDGLVVLRWLMEGNLTVI